MPSDKERLTAYVEPSLLKRIKIHCAKRGFTISTFVEVILRRELKETKGEEKENGVRDA